MTIEDISDNEILKSFNDLIPYIPFWFDDDVAFTISNKERFIKVVNGKNIKLSTKAGEKIPVGCCAYECLKAEKPVTLIVPKEVFGTEYEFKTYGIPVKDVNGEVVGTFVVGKVLTNLDDNNMTNKINSITDNALNIVNNINQEINVSEINAKTEVKVGDFDEVYKELKQEIKKLQILSRIDDLTGISNRRYFNEIFFNEYKRAVRMQQPISLVMIDIDFFKKYNDYYGHILGDSSLKNVAQAISKESKRPGDFVARYGGEEFVVLLPSTDLMGAKEVAERIISAVDSLNIPHKESPISSKVTISCGVGTITSFVGCNCLDLLERADKALYKAKENCRNRIEVYEAS